MKNLKRALSLVLVMALAFSLLAVASAATINDYTDKADITQVEAVDVLTKIGILEGTNGAFNPKMNISRQEAAKIMAFVVLGTAASKLVNTPTSSFSDVPATSWANPYIEYCYNAGIIKGVGGGLFDPFANVTGSQMATMLLRALGYGQKGEYEGPSWENNAIRDGMRYGILTSDVDYSAPATREEVALYALNALATTQVAWSDLFGGYISQTGLGTLAVNLKPLGEDVFNLIAVPSTDDFGYGGRYWTFNNKVITDIFPLDTIVAQFTSSGATNQGYFFNQGAWDANFELWVNGWTPYSTTAPYPQIVYPSNTIAVRGSNTAVAGLGTGAWVTLVDSDDNGKIDKVIVTYEYLAKVTKVNATAGTVDLDLYSKGATPKFPGVVAEGFAVNDFVLVTPKNIAIDEASETIQPLKVVKATTVTAQIDSHNFSTNMSITFGGKTYLKSAVASLGFADAPAFKKDIVFYFDSHDNIVGYNSPTTAAADHSYVFLKNAKIEQDAFDLSVIAKVSVIYMDGKADILNLPVNAQGKVIVNGAPVDATMTAVTLNSFYSYVINSDGTISLNNLPAGAFEATSAITFTEANPSVTVAGDPDASARFATSATQLITVKNGTATTVTGYANFKDSHNVTVSAGVKEALVIYSSAAATAPIVKIYVVDTVVPTTTTYGIISKVGATVGTNLVVYDILVWDELEAKINPYTCTAVAGAKVGDMIKLSKTGDTNTIAYLQVGTDTTTNPPDDGPVVTGATVASADAGYFVVGSTALILDAKCLVLDEATGGIGTIAKDQKVSYFTPNGTGAKVTLVVIAKP